MNNFGLAIQYSKRLVNCKTITELDSVALEIKNNETNLKDYIDWLRDEYVSQKTMLIAPRVSLEDMLNKKGKEALKQELLF